MTRAVDWRGVFPAVTTQFAWDDSPDLQATARIIEALIQDGVSGLIVCGTVGEGTTLTRAEKAAVMEMASGIAKGRVPVIAGIAEYTTAFAAETAREAVKAGVDGLMVMPAMVYAAKPRETVAHFRAMAKATDLPLMIYNNPPVYKTDVTPVMLAELADCETVVCFKESSGDTRRFTDLRNLTGDRFIMFAGLDDVILESVLLGAEGWVSGMSNVFPREGEALFRLAKARRIDEARTLYDWFMPLLHLDARPDLVQCIKLCEQIAGRGSERTRPPRLPLEGVERAEVEALMAAAMAARPDLAALTHSDVALPQKA
jgi:dihydrodipicolinate synthase/N-acetylneuraminate lyase